MSLVKRCFEHEPCRYGQGCWVEPEHGQVKIIQSRYLREGEKVLLGKERGGRRYSNLIV